MSSGMGLATTRPTSQTAGNSMILQILKMLGVPEIEAFAPLLRQMGLGNQLDNLLFPGGAIPTVNMGMSSTMDVVFGQKEMLRDFRAQQVGMEIDVESFQKLLGRGAAASGIDGMKEVSPALLGMMQFAGGMFGVDPAALFGGSAAGLASSVNTASRRLYDGDGQRISEEEVKNITKGLLSEMRTEGGGTDFSFTRGFKAQEIGTMVEWGASQGIFRADEGDGEDVTSLRDVVTKKTGKMIETMEVLRDLMGRPDAPVNELIQSMNDMFGTGALATVGAEGLKGILQKAETLRLDMGISGDHMMALLNRGSKMGVADGLAASTGAVLELGSMDIAESARRTNAQRTLADGEWDLGAKSSDEMQQLMSHEYRSMANSEMANSMGAIETAALDNPQFAESSEYKELVALYNKRDKTPEEYRRLDEKLTQSAVRGMFERQGLGAAAADGYLGDREANQARISEDMMSGKVDHMALIRENRRSSMILRVQQTTGMSEQQATGAMDALVSAKSGSRADQMAALEAYTGGDTQRAAQLRANFGRAASASGTTLDTFITAYGDETRESQIDRTAHANVSRELAESIRARGEGASSSQGGLMNMAERAVASIMEGKTDIRSIALDAFASPDADVMNAALGDENFKRRMQELTKGTERQSDLQSAVELNKMHADREKELRTATGDRKKQLEIEMEDIDKRFESITGGKSMGEVKKELDDLAEKLKKSKEELNTFADTLSKIKSPERSSTELQKEYQTLKEAQDGTSGEKLDTYRKVYDKYLDDEKFEKSTEGIKKSYEERAKGIDADTDLTPAEKEQAKKEIEAERDKRLEEMEAKRAVYKYEEQRMSDAYMEDDDHTITRIYNTRMESVKGERAEAKRKESERDRIIREAGELIFGKDDPDEEGAGSAEEDEQDTEDGVADLAKGDSFADSTWTTPEQKAARERLEKSTSYELFKTGGMTYEEMRGSLKEGDAEILGFPEQIPANMESFYKTMFDGVSLGGLPGGVETADGQGAGAGIPQTIHGKVAMASQNQVGRLTQHEGIEGDVTITLRSRA